MGLLISTLFLLAVFADTLCFQKRAHGCSAAVVVWPACEWSIAMREKTGQNYSLENDGDRELAYSNGSTQLLVVCVVLSSKQQRASVSSEDTESGRSSPDPQPHSQRRRHNRRSESLPPQQPPASPLNPVDT